jgi:hypothetical protein
MSRHLPPGVSTSGRVSLRNVAGIAATLDHRADESVAELVRLTAADVAG